MSSQNEEIENQSVSQKSIKEENRIGDAKEHYNRKKEWPKGWKEEIEQTFNPQDFIQRLTPEEKAIKEPNKEHMTKAIKQFQEMTNEKQKQLKSTLDQIKDYMFSDPEFQAVINQIKNNNEQKKELITINKDLHNKKNSLKTQIEEMTNQIKFINSKFYKEKTWKKEKLLVLYKQKISEYESSKKKPEEQNEDEQLKDLKQEITQIYFTLMHLDKAYELKIKRDDMSNLRQNIIVKVTENQARINELTEESKELRNKNEEVKGQIEIKLKDNPLVQKLEAQKKKIQDEIADLKKSIEDVKQDFNERYEKYDQIKFKNAQIKYKEELKRQYKEKQYKNLKDQKFKEKIEKDSNQKIEELKQQHSELLEKLQKAEDLLQGKLNDKKSTVQDQAVQGSNTELLITKKPKEEIVYSQKHKKAHKEESLFDNQTVIQFSMLEIRAPTKFDEIEKTILAIQRMKSLKQKLFDEEIKKMENKKDQILSGEM